MIFQCRTIILCISIYLHNLVSALESHRKLLRTSDGTDDANTEKNYKIAVHASIPWDRSRQDFPCVPESSPHTQGIFYVKVSNTASTLLAAIIARIARREAKRQGKDACKVHDTTRNLPANVLNIRNRDKRRSFLFSMVRHPSSRAIGFYSMRIHGGVPDNTFNSFISLLEDNSKFAPNMQLRFLSSMSSPVKIPEDQYRSYIRSVIDEYDFIGVYDRLHESLVVLAMLIGVSTNDVLFTFSEEGCPDRKKEQPDWLTPAMMCYLNTNRWKSREMGDYLLHDAVNRSLDLTIDRLGREKVKEAVDRFEQSLLVGRKVYGKKNGCGIPNLSKNPYADPSEFPWYQRVSPEDKLIFNHNDEFSG